MTPGPPERIPAPPLLLLVAAALVGAQFAWQGHMGFNLWDEGFLWYGVQRVLAGEVPIRDFMAYDPGRYLWSAVGMALAGTDGMGALRLTTAAFQVAGVFVGLLVLARRQPTPGLAYGACAAAILIVWMIPRHKLYDATLSLALIALLAWLARSPSARRCFWVGVGVGVAGIFGRNHAAYGVAGSVLVYALALPGPGTAAPGRAVACWASGIVTGYLPMLIAMLAVPGFGAAVVESVRLMLAAGSTNLPLPVPWPWRVDAARLPAFDAIRAVAIGAGFLAVAAFAAIGTGWMVWRRFRRLPVEPGLAACIGLAPAYAHYAFSRADLGHLALGIFPLLVGLMLVVAGWRPAWRWTGLAAILAVSLVAAGPSHPGWAGRVAGGWVRVDVGGDELLMDAATAGDIRLLRELADCFAPEGRSFVAAPFWPGAYALLRRRAPVWEIYPLFPREAAFERREIARLKESAPGFAIIYDAALDGRDELRFRRTHPLIWEHLAGEMEPVGGFSDRSDYLIFRDASGRK